MPGNPDARSPGVTDRTPEVLRGRTWLVVQATIVAFTFLVMLDRYGAGFFCFDVGILLFGYLLAFIVASFPRDVRRRHKFRTAGLAAIGAMASLVAFAQTAPVTLFASYVTFPVPPSVRVLDAAYQRGRGTAVYLHFQLSSSDLKTVLQTRPYTADGKDGGPIGMEPSWWPRARLMHMTIHHWRATDGQYEAWLWVNEPGTEAYFTFRNY